MRARLLGGVAVTALLVVLLQGVALASFRDEAPADEYFGPFKISVLEIKNRLTRFEAQPNRELVMSGTIHGIDTLELAIVDWHRRYPRDSWLPGFLSRMVRVYVRAHASHDFRAHEIYAMLQQGYARSVQARDSARIAKRMFL